MTETELCVMCKKNPRYRKRKLCRKCINKKERDKYKLKMLSPLYKELHKARSRYNSNKTEKNKKHYEDVKEKIKQKKNDEQNIKTMFLICNLYDTLSERAKEKTRRMLECHTTKVN